MCVVVCVCVCVHVRMCLWERAFLYSVFKAKLVSIYIQIYQKLLKVLLQKSDLQTFCRALCPHFSQPQWMDEFFNDHYYMYEWMNYSMIIITCTNGWITQWSLLHIRQSGHCSCFLTFHWLSYVVLCEHTFFSKCVHWFAFSVFCWPISSVLFFNDLKILFRK